MYSNVLIKELLEINRFMYSQNDIVEEVSKEITKYSKNITQQNYFQQEDLQYVKEEGLALGSPTSPIFF